jgi:hypothetical protein
MHPQRRTKTDAKAIKVKKTGELHAPTAPSRSKDASGAPDVGQTGERRMNVSFAVPRITGVSAVGAGSGLIVAVATGNVEPVYVWPCVALAGLGMAYDLGRRILTRPPRR